MSSLTTLALPLLLLGHLFLGFESSSSSTFLNVEGTGMPGACNPTTPFCSATAVEVSGCAIAALIAQRPHNKVSFSERPSNECFDINLLDFCTQVVNGINYMFTAEVTLKQSPACQQHKNDCSILTAKIYESPRITGSLPNNGNLISCENGREFLIEQASWSSASYCSGSFGFDTCPVNLDPAQPIPPYEGSMQQHSLESNANKRRLGYEPNLRKMRKVRRMRKGLKPKPTFPTSIPTTTPTSSPSGVPRTSSPYHIPHTKAPSEATGSMRRMLQYTSQSMSQGGDDLIANDNLIGDDYLVSDDANIDGDDANLDGNDDDYDYDDDDDAVISSTISQRGNSCNLSSAE